MNQDEALIYELKIRFDRKPRKCFKINDSKIGSAQRIVSINNNTFYYFPKIQEFQDLDFDKLQYVVPKAGVKLADITQLRFPPRRQNERNFFTITLPKNRILKFTKTLQEIIVDEAAEGEQEWTFHFAYDIVSLPNKEKKAEEARLKEIEKEKQRRLELMKLKEKQEREKADKINEEITSLNQAEQLRSGGENEEYLLKRQQLNQKEQNQKRMQQADQLFFHYHYRKLGRVNGQRERAQAQLTLLKQIGRFRARAEETVREFIDQLSFAPIKLKNNHQYHYNNLILKFGDKGLNQQFLANSETANAVLATRHLTSNWQLRVPLKALVKYKGFKVLVCAATPLETLNAQQFDDAIMHGHSSDNWKIHFMIVQALTIILDYLKLKPYFSQVHYQKVLIHFGSQLKVIETPSDPFSSIKQLQSSAFPEDRQYKVTYMYDIDEVFPIDLDLNRSINQQNVRLRPEYVRMFIEKGKGHTATHLSAGAMTYAFDDQQGQKQDLLIAKASQMMKLQELVLFVRRLDNLDYIIDDSAHLSRVMKKNGINMRYLGRIIKISQLPYIRALGQIDAIARVIRNMYRQHQKQFVVELFRHGQNQPLIAQTYHPQIKPTLKKIRIKQLREEQKKASKANAVDFLNLVFGVSNDSVPFWTIVRKQVLQKYQFQMKDPQDYAQGYLLKTVAYRCGISVPIHDKLQLFLVESPFSIDDNITFNPRSKAYDFPSMSIYKLADTAGINADQPQRLLARLQLQLQICQALQGDQSQILIQLSKITSDVGAPSDKFTLQSFLYLLNHPTADNFEAIHTISQWIFPPTHPRVMEMYLAYAKIAELDPVVLKKAAQNHAIRNLGISHWRTSEILSNFKEIEYINHLMRAEPGVAPGKKTELYLNIVRELAKYGKLYDSMQYVIRAINTFDHRTDLTTQEQFNYYEILLQGIEAHYITRTIQELLTISQKFYDVLRRYKVAADSKWYYWLLYYTLKVFLESSNKKYYLFKLIILFNQRPHRPLVGKERSQLFQVCWQSWKEAINHINHIKDVLRKLEFGYTEISFLNNFFNNFDKLVLNLNNEDYNQGLKQYEDLFRIFGYDYFKDALCQNFYAFEKRRENRDQKEEEKPDK